MFKTQSANVDPRWQSFPHRQWSFSGDVAALALTAVLNPGKTGIVASLPIVEDAGPRNWLDAFVAAFPLSRGSWMERLATRLSHPLLEEYFVAPTPERHFPLASELFPTRSSRLERIFESSRVSWDRHPELETHFPPSRVL
jgi:hypothetical protein